MFEEENEESNPTQSTTTNQPTMPIMEQVEIKVHPGVNFHGELIIPKVEPIDWESLPIRELNIPIPITSKRRKNTTTKPIKFAPFQSKTLSKSKPTVNKGDQLFICDIKEFSYINLN